MPPPGRRPGRATWAVAVLATPLLAGCGGAARTPERGHTLHVSLDEYRIVPQDVTVTAGRLRVVARNTGTVPHNLEIESTTRRDRNGHPLALAHTHIARPGEVVALRVTLRTGRYRMSCAVSNHDALGQWGTIRVVARRSARGHAETLGVPGAG